MFFLKYKSLPVLTGLLLVFFACEQQSKISSEVAKIPVELKISRFDQMLGDDQNNNLEALKKAFPFLFDSRIPDSVWIQKFNDPIQRELLTEVGLKYESLGLVNDDLNNFYRHQLYYFPNFQLPEIITLTNDVDYRNKVIVTDSLVLIALDNYLGSDHHFYKNISKFYTINMTSGQVISDLAELYAQEAVIQTPPRMFLEEMVYQGKILYYKDLMVPFKSDASKIGYTPDQLLWAEENEASIWTYFVENELLYSTDTKLNSRFINPAPYSKFYLELDNESPGRIGAYMGWQIVRAYADNSGEDLDVIMRKSAKELFEESKFKPRK